MCSSKPLLRLRDLLCFLVIVLAPCITAKSQQTGNCARCAVPSGMIKGRVFTSRRGVARGIAIYAVRLDQEKSQVKTAEVDEKGFFQLIVPAGQYAVYAGNQILGYPESYDGIYLDTVKPLKITVSPDKVIEVKVSLGRPLRSFSGSIVDSATGRYVEDATLRISLVEDRTRYLETAPDLHGRFNVLSPPASFTLSVQAPGYETKEVSLQPNFSKSLRVALKRRNSAQRNPVLPFLRTNKNALSKARAFGTL